MKLVEDTDNSIFITGRAGTGKSTLLRVLTRTSKKKIVVLAPTGIAALNVKGQTIHSFFKFKPAFLSKSDVKRRRQNKIYNTPDVIVIDEISMVRADMLDNIDLFLRLNRNNPLPFGGVQMVFIGDLYQIPPVVSTEFEKKFVSENYESPFFFSADVLNSQDFEYSMVELTQIYRQTKMGFIRILESIRMNEMDWDLLNELNERHNPEEIKPGYYITLSARNHQADRINFNKLKELEGQVYTYDAMVKGNFPINTLPTDYTLSLKVGAQVMFIRNDNQKRYVNGTIGIVKHLEPDKVVVEVMSEAGEKMDIQVENEEWESIKYVMDTQDPKTIKQEVIGTFSQYPLKLAWAITIHKSQGKTFDNIIIDLGNRGAFASGQTYVALSRCTDLEGIVLKTKIRPQDIIVDNRIVDFLENKRRY